MRIAALCSSSMGIPALAQLAGTGTLVALGTPDTTSDTVADMQQLATYTRLPLQTFTKVSFHQQLVQWLELSKPDVVFVITFPFKIGADALAIPKLGFYNFHLALLPEYRGPNPIFWQIKNQSGKGGISVHKMDAGFDTGPLVWREEMPINTSETYGEHSSRLTQACVPVMLHIAHQLRSNGANLPQHVQNNDDARYWPRPQLEDLIIHWDEMTAKTIQLLVNACNPWNKGAYTALNSNPIRITEVMQGTTPVISGTTAGTIIHASPVTGLEVACCDGKSLHVSVLFTGDCFISGQRLIQHGILKGMCFNSSPLAAITVQNTKN